MKKIFLIAFTFVIAITQIFSQNEDPFVEHFTKINKALNIGNVDIIAQYFSSSVDLSVLDKEGIFSASQAENILKEFFTKNEAKKYTMIHFSGKDNSRYYIGTLTTNTGDYRVFYVLKNTIKYPVITQFRIEKKTH
jgi:hypothetical protein